MRHCVGACRRHSGRERELCAAPRESLCHIGRQRRRHLFPAISWGCSVRKIPWPGTLCYDVLTVESFEENGGQDGGSDAGNEPQDFDGASAFHRAEPAMPTRPLPGMDATASSIIASPMNAILRDAMTGPCFQPFFPENPGVADTLKTRSGFLPISCGQRRI